MNNKPKLVVKLKSIITNQTSFNSSIPFFFLTSFAYLLIIPKDFLMNFGIDNFTSYAFAQKVSKSASFIGFSLTPAPASIF